MPDMWMDVDAAVKVPMNIAAVMKVDGVTIEDAMPYNATGIAVQWNFVTTAGARTSTAITPTTSGDYDITEDIADKGMFSIEIPASGGASVNNDTEGFGWITGRTTADLPFRGPIIGFRAAGLNNLLIDSAYSATRGLAGTALPEAAANAAGGVPVSTAGGLDLDAKLANTNEITAARMGALTDWINGGRLDLLLDSVITTVITNAAGDDVAADIIALKAVADAIKAKSDNLPSDPADQSAVEAAITAAHSTTNGKIDAVDDYIDTELAAITAAVITNAAGTDVAADIIALKAVADLIQKIIRNKIAVTEATGAATLYDDDNTTPLLTNTVTSAAGTTTRTRLA